MAKSFQHRRIRQRPSRVNISYDVETGGAMEKKEIPFVMGVMSDLSGDGLEDLPEVADRKFTEVSADTFDKVLKGMNPRLQFAVDNKLEEDSDEKIGVELNFRDFSDFSPEKVARQVEPLKKLLDRREDLLDLKGRLQTNRKFSKGFNKTLQDALGDPDQKKKLESEVEDEGGDDDGGS
ncbi:MAG: type VI secretion system contractile sheath small subunit [Gemmatimonadetes bacterium]|nr:type VI secretion system contractile sheath small subunit [Gemmatimonadota bacterium]NNM05447.1 type VI secretion system contractile sheath small subunit [Gemmatimonadota bacterium]